MLTTVIAGVSYRPSEAIEKDWVETTATGSDPEFDEAFEVRVRAAMWPLAA